MADSRGRILRGRISPEIDREPRSDKRSKKASKCEVNQFGARRIAERIHACTTDDAGRERTTLPARIPAHLAERSAELTSGTRATTEPRRFGARLSYHLQEETIRQAEGGFCRRPWAMRSAKGRFYRVAKPTLVFVPPLSRDGGDIIARYHHARAIPIYSMSPSGTPLVHSRGCCARVAFSNRPRERKIVVDSSSMLPMKPLGRCNRLDLLLLPFLPLTN